MANDKLLDRFEDMAGVDNREDLGAALDRILTGPQQETLAEALAADAVDVIPVFGDLSALSRQRRAEELGIDYPARPSIVENAISDLPPPFDTIGDIIIAQNTVSHLENEQGIPIASELEDVTTEGTDTFNTLIDNLVGPQRS